MSLKSAFEMKKGVTKFATTHVLRDYNPDRTTVRNGWKHCECEVDGKWISTYSLPL